MSDSLLSFTLIFAELGGALLLIAGVIYFIFKLKKRWKKYSRISCTCKSDPPQKP